MGLRKRLGRLPLVQYWDSECPPADVVPLIDSCASCNPDMRHLLFDRAGADAFIAAHFSARETAAFRACAVPAMQADYFRYCALLALGGAYVDADFRCLAGLQSLFKRRVSARLFGRAKVPSGWPADLFGERPRIGPYRIVANSIFACAAPDHPLLRLALEVATANIENRIAEDVAVTTGPGIFTSLYLADRLGSLEAFRDYAGGGVLELTADLFCAVVGSHERIAAAFEGVCIRPFGESQEVAVAAAPDELAYKSSENHWTNYRGSIFAG